MTSGNHSNQVKESGFQVYRSCLLSLICQSQRVGWIYIAYQCVGVVSERSDPYAGKIQWD
jgi:hypothetical protein